MSDYTLDHDEVVILQDHSVTYGVNRVSLVLTNRNLIQVNRSIFGGTKGFEKHPLTCIKSYNGKPNILIGKFQSGGPSLNIFFDGFEKVYKFDALLGEVKWANSISKAYKERISELEKIERLNNPEKSIFDTVKGTIISAKSSILPKSSSLKNLKCPMCGAEISGEKGEEVQCSYCQYVFAIK